MTKPGTYAARALALINARKGEWVGAKELAIAVGLKETKKLRLKLEGAVRDGVVRRIAFREKGSLHVSMYSSGDGPMPPVPTTLPVAASASAAWLARQEREKKSNLALYMTNRIVKASEAEPLVKEGPSSVFELSAHL